MWLCDECVLAYHKEQFCEICGQIYLNDTEEFSTLDGREWAQCEGRDKCGRWIHVECLMQKYGKTYKEVISDQFKYICCNCNLNGKRKTIKKNYCKSQDKSKRLD